MKKLKCKIRKTTESAIFHNTRADVRLLARVVNELHDKINEIIERLEEIKPETKYPKL